MKLSECYVGMRIKELGYSSKYVIRKVNPQSVTTSGGTIIKEKQLENYYSISDVELMGSEIKDYIVHEIDNIWRIDSLKKSLATISSFIKYDKEVIEYLKIDSDKIVNDINETLDNINKTMEDIKKYCKERFDNYGK